MHLQIFKNATSIINQLELVVTTYLPIYLPTCPPTYRHPYLPTWHTSLPTLRSQILCKIFPPWLPGSTNLPTLNIFWQQRIWMENFDTKSLADFKRLQCHWINLFLCLNQGLISSQIKISFADDKFTNFDYFLLAWSFKKVILFFDFP